MSSRMTGAGTQLRTFGRMKQFPSKFDRGWSALPAGSSRIQLRGGAEKHPGRGGYETRFTPLQFKLPMP